MRAVLLPSEATPGSPAAREFASYTTRALLRAAIEAAAVWGAEEDAVDPPSRYERNAARQRLRRIGDLLEQRGYRPLRCGWIRHGWVLLTDGY